MLQIPSSDNLGLKIVCCLAMVSGGMIAGSLGPILVPIADFFGLRIGEMVFPVLFMMTGFLTAGVINSFIWRIHRARLLLSLSALCVLLSLSGIVFWHENMGIILALLFSVGLSRGVLQTGINALFSEMFGKDRVKYLNISLLFFGLGAFFGPLLVGIVLSYAAQWYVVYFLIVLVSLPFPIVFWRKKLYRSAIFSKNQVSHEACLEKKPFSSTPFWVIVLATFILLGVQTSFFSWIPLFLVRIRGISPVGASYSVSIFWLSMLSGRVLYSRFLSKTDLSRSLIVGVSGAVLFSFLSFSFTGFALIILCLVCLGLLISFVSPGLLALGGNTFPKHVGFVTGILTVSSSIGSIFFPWCIGLTSQKLGLVHGVFIIPVFSLGVVGILIYFRYFLAKKIG